MATDFGNSKDINFINELEKDRTTNSESYAELLNNFRNEVAKKRHFLFKKTILFHTENKSAHSLLVTMTKFNELSLDFFFNPLYSLDLVPNDYHLLPDHKTWFGGKKGIVINEEVINAINAYFERLYKSF